MTPPAASARSGPQRLHALDALRGVLAISVMLFHVLPGYPLAIGSWAVPGFFVISGYAMDHVYRERFDLRTFVVARVARLVPLWVPVVLISAIWFNRTNPGLVALNLTGAFGFVEPGRTSIPSGGWSIGIEAVFYALFPILVRCSTRVIAAIALGSVALRWVYVGGLWFIPFDDATWVSYTAMPSFLVFFALGMLASRLRLVRGTWTGRKAGFAVILGDMSYGVYLLHFLLWGAIGPIFAALFSPVLALAVFHVYERPAGRVIKRLPGGERPRWAIVRPRRSARPAGTASQLDNERGLAA
jgi:peptidoglycan/LPS O-acetylase OafA/YrhL